MNSHISTGFISIIDLKLTTTTVATTEKLPIYCDLPAKTKTLDYDVLNATAVVMSSVLEGAGIRYKCARPDQRMIDGEPIHTCSSTGRFSGVMPLCVTRKSAKREREGKREGRERGRRKGGEGGRGGWEGEGGGGVGVCVFF